MCLFDVFDKIEIQSILQNSAFILLKVESNLQFSSALMVSRASFVENGEAVQSDCRVFIRPTAQMPF